MSGRCRSGNANLRIWIFICHTNWTGGTIRGLCCKNQITALWQHTSHTQAAHLHWVHTSDYTSGVTCTVHNDCWGVFFPTSVFSPKSLASVLLRGRSAADTHGEKSRSWEDRECCRDASEVHETLLLFTVWPHMGRRVQNSGCDTDWQFLILTL